MNLYERVTDPFGFARAFDHFGLEATDLPGMTRDCRMAGAGC